MTDEMKIGLIFGHGDVCFQCKDEIIAEMSLKGLVFICLGCGNRSDRNIGYFNGYFERRKIC